MFGKLLKYDFRSMWKQFAFIWPAALALALVNLFTISSLEGSSTVGETTAGVAMLIYVSILIAMFIIAVIFVIQRFYKGLLGDEGYLMHTLPVRSWQLVGSKLLCAVITTAVNVVVAIFSIFLIIPWNHADFQEIIRAFQYLFSHWDINATYGVLGIVESILFMLVSFATGFLQLYLAMSVGHLFNKNRVAMSVIAFIAVNTVVGILLNTASPAMEHVFSAITAGTAGLCLYLRSICIAIVGELILSAIYFVGTEYILRNKLNLE